MDEFKKDIVKIASKTVPNVSDSMLEFPKDASLGDLALPCFLFSKEMKKSPNEIAKTIAENSQSSDLIEKIVATGPYVNFFIRKSKLSELILNEVAKLKQLYGKSLSGKGKTVLIEFSQPNTNKPQHVGHVRNDVLGAAISSVLDFSSYKAIRANIINDRGIHICKSMIAYKKWGENKEPDKKPDHFVGDFYVLFNNDAKENPDIENEAYEMLRLWEAGDKDVRALWKKMNNWVLKGFDETYDRLGIKFDVVQYESELYEKGRKIVEEGFEKGLLKKNAEGAIYAELEELGVPDKVVLRADGTAIYVTQDIYLAKLRYDQYNFDRSIYVVGSEQNLYFKQLFAIMKRLGFEFAEKLYHKSYGMVNLPEGKMKSREGTVVDADDIITEMVTLAREEIMARYSDLTENEVNKRANAIGIGAIKFFMLKQDSVKDILFDPKESISFEGETGPYVQYSYARICSILKKYGKPVSEAVDFSLLGTDAEQNIIKCLAEFSVHVEDASKNLDPSKIAHYLIKLAQAFNEFYHACPVITEEAEMKKARILLVYCVKQVLGNGLNLLGIEMLEEM